jgi:magnesium-transporting ATPase (P-type)
MGSREQMHDLYHSVGNALLHDDHELWHQRAGERAWHSFLDLPKSYIHKNRMLEQYGRVEMLHSGGIFIPIRNWKVFSIWWVWNLLIANTNQYFLCYPFPYVWSILQNRTNLCTIIFFIYLSFLSIFSPDTFRQVTMPLSRGLYQIT